MIGLCLLTTTGLLPAQTRQLAVVFNNLNPKYAPADVHFMFGGGGAVQGTIDCTLSNAVVALVPNQDYTLAQIGSRGITISNFIGGKIFVSLGGSVVSTNAGYNPGYPDFAPGSGDPASQVRWDKVEATIFASTNATPGSGLNLSAADFFSIPMQVVTMKNGTNVSTIGWHPPTTTASVFSNLAALTFTNTGYAAVSAVTAAAISNGIPTTINGAISNVLRVISPANISAAAVPNPYPTFNSYLAYVQNSNLTAQIVGTYGGLIPIPANTPLPAAAFSNQTYNFTASIHSNGDLVLVGQGALVGNQTLTVPNTNVAAGMYSGAPVYYLSSVTTTNLQNYNSMYDQVLSDAIAGFNLGLVGCPHADPRTGTGLTNGPIGLENADAWFSRGPTYGLNPQLKPDQLFTALWPQGQKFYDPFAAYLSPITDAYSFPYTDKSAAPFVNLTYGAADTFVITILPDAPVPPVTIRNAAPLPGGGIQFTFDVPAGTPYLIEASQNLTSWRTNYSGTGQAGSESYTNAAGTNVMQFYRIKL